VLFTQGQPSVAGYTPYGSLFRGSGAWAVKPSKLPTGGISDHGAAAVGDYVYLFGGAAQGDAASAPLLGALWRYDSVYETFTQLPPMPVPYVRFASAATDDTIYVIGGLGGDTGVGQCWDDPAGASCAASGVNFATVADVEGGNPGRAGWATWAYNTSAAVWSTNAGRLNVPRSDACAAVINGLLYVVGGYTDYYNITDSLEVLDPSAAVPAWKQLPPLPAPRGDVSCAALDGKLFVFGGYYDPFCAAPGGCFNTDVAAGGDARAGAGAVDGVSNFRTETWMYDPRTATWTPRAPMRYARGDAAATSLPRGRLLVAGGEHNLRTTAIKVPQHSVEMYFAAEDVWAEKAPLPFARFRFALAAVGQTAHAFGGQQLCSDVASSGSAALNFSTCQATASDTYSVLFELDHPHVFVQLPDAVGQGLTFDDALRGAAYIANLTRRR
jgi:N-acetylneuraminic acid mutarotase